MLSPGDDFLCWYDVFIIEDATLLSVVTDMFLWLVLLLILHHVNVTGWNQRTKGHVLSLQHNIHLSFKLIIISKSVRFCQIWQKYNVNYWKYYTIILLVKVTRTCVWCGVAMELQHFAHCSLKYGFFHFWIGESKHCDLDNKTLQRTVGKFCMLFPCHERYTQNDQQQMNWTVWFQR